MKIKNISLIIILMTIITLINFTSAVGNIGVVKQNECIDLTNFCPTCSYINLTAIQYPNGTSLDRNDAMTKSNNNYNFTFCDTILLGDYSYTTCGDKAGVVACEKITFESTPSGRTGNSNIAFIIILLLIIYSVTLISFFGKNIPLSILTGMMMTFFGVYIIRNGIVIYRDNLTNYFGYITIAIGATIAIISAIALIEGDN